MPYGVPRHRASNNAGTTLSGAILAGATSLTVASATGFPSAPFFITINSEIIKVGAVSGTTFSSLSRGQESTSAAGHSDGIAVEHRWTAGMYERLLDEDFLIEYWATI